MSRGFGGVLIWCRGVFHHLAHNLVDIVGRRDQHRVHFGFSVDGIGRGAGNDTLLGNAGFDALNPFEVLDFSGLSLFGATTDVMESAILDGNNVLIDTGPDSSILLVNVDLADLDGLGFLF